MIWRGVGIVEFPDGGDELFRRHLALADVDREPPLPVGFVRDHSRLPGMCERRLNLSGVRGLQNVFPTNRVQLDILVRHAGA